MASPVPKGSGYFCKGANQTKRSAIGGPHSNTPSYDSDGKRRQCGLQCCKDVQAMGIKPEEDLEAVLTNLEKLLERYGMAVPPLSAAAKIQSTASPYNTARGYKTVEPQAILVGEKPTAVCQPEVVEERKQIHSADHGRAQHTLPALRTVIPATAPAQRSQQPTQKASGSYKVYKEWEDMQLHESIMAGVAEMGYDKPSAVQSVCIDPLRDGRHMLLQAQSGMGKTAAYTLCCLENIRRHSGSHRRRDLQCLVLCPNMELAEQVGKSMSQMSRKFGESGSLRATVITLARSSSLWRQRSSLAEDRPNIVVGTPGRVLQLVKGGHLSLDKLHTLVLDEADLLVQKEDTGGIKTGNRQEIMQILRSGLPKAAQAILTSATINANTEDFMECFESPFIYRGGDMVSSIVHGKAIFPAESREEAEEAKLDWLQQACQHNRSNSMIVFCTSKAQCEKIDSRLREVGFAVSASHGGMGAVEREAAMESFRISQTKVLVCTDGLARGMDVQQVSVVVNFKLPYEASNYVQRVGRCGRFGRRGVAVSLVWDSNGLERDEMSSLRRMEERHREAVYVREVSHPMEVKALLES